MEDDDDGVTTTFDIGRNEIFQPKPLTNATQYRLIILGQKEMKN